MSWPGDYDFSCEVIMPFPPVRIFVIEPSGTPHGRMALPPDDHASTCASLASAWGSQQVISIARYSSTAAESATRACAG
jgi:hypothetical protein